VLIIRPSSQLFRDAPALIAGTLIFGFASGCPTRFTMVARSHISPAAGAFRLADSTVPEWPSQRARMHGPARPHARQGMHGRHTHSTHARHLYAQHGTARTHRMHTHAWHAHAQRACMHARHGTYTHGMPSRGQSRWKRQHAKAKRTQKQELDRLGSSKVPLSMEPPHKCDGPPPPRGAKGEEREAYANPSGAPPLSPPAAAGGPASC